VIGSLAYPTIKLEIENEAIGKSLYS